MRVGGLFLIIVLTMILSTGCWDQQLLKDERIAYIVSYDLDPSGKIMSTISILDVSKSQSGGDDYSEIHTVVGDTSRHTRDIIDREVPGRLAVSKLRVILLGEALARKGIYPILDVYYRDPRSALNAKIAVVQGNAKDMINQKLSGSMLIGDHYNTLIQSAENRTVVPKVNLQLICPKMLDVGDDFAIPYITNDARSPSISGTAVFNGDQMRGTLSSEDSLLYLLMDKELSKRASLTVKVNNEKGEKPENYLAMDIQKVKRKMKINVRNSNQIQVKMDIKLMVSAIEYPRDHLNLKPTLSRLNKTLSEELTSRANSLIEKMQRLNHDGFAIGRRIMAYYPNTWEKLDWEEDYKKVQFDPKITVEIVNHGIIN